MASQRSGEVKQEVHVMIFPLLAHGHMIPLFDLARLLAIHGVKSTIVTTPANASVFSKSENIEIEIIRFPSEVVGLPEGLENIGQITDIEISNKFMKAMKMISDEPLEKLLLKLRPNCVIGDMFVPWTADVACKVGIPWIAFYGGGYFSLSVTGAIRRFKPQWSVESDDEEFVVPDMPRGEVRMTRKKLHPAWTTKEDKNMHANLVELAVEAAEEKSFGVIVNSFYELEKDYVDHYQKVIGRRCWSLGPLSLRFRNIEDNAMRGKEASIDVHACLRWLNSKPSNSVIYVCFGSIAQLSLAQLYEIAMGLEASGQNFIWAVRRANIGNKVDEEEWLPNGFEAKNREKGLIIRGWAPQVLILDHKAIGGFVTHCGWNSILEGMSAGVPLVTWPMFAEQFKNEMLITEVLRVGVPVGAQHNYDWMIPDAKVGKAAIEAAVRRVMVGEEAEEMRRTASVLKELARKAVQEEGSSKADLGELLKKISSLDGFSPHDM